MEGDRNVFSSCLSPCTLSFCFRFVSWRLIRYDADASKRTSAGEGQGAIRAVAQYEPASMLALLMLLITGVVAGFMNSLWGTFWIWISLGLLIAIGLVMSVLGTEHYDAVRAALGLPKVHSKRGETLREELADAQELESLLRFRKPLITITLGFLGLAAILWLMMFKPF